MNYETPNCQDTAIVVSWCHIKLTINDRVFMEADWSRPHKITVQLDIDAETKLKSIFIKRFAENHRRCSKTAMIEDAIDLLFEIEMRGTL